MVANAAPSHQPPYGIPVSCPCCASMECDRAEPHGMQDFLRGLRGLYPWQCRGCGARFYVHRQSLG